MTPLYRCPTGDSLSEIRVRVVALDGHPVLDVRTFRRSTDDFSVNGMHPTAQGVTVPLQYAETLIDAVRRAALAADDPRQDAA